MTMVPSTMEALITPLLHVSSQVGPVPVSCEALDCLLAANMMPKDATMIVVEELLPELHRVLFYQTKDLAHRA